MRFHGIFLCYLGGSITGGLGTLMVNGLLDVAWWQYWVIVVVVAVVIGLAIRFIDDLIEWRRDR